MTARHEQSDILTDPNENPRSECCDVLMEWIECEACDGTGNGALFNCDPASFAYRVCRPCKGDGGEWTCPECNL